MEAAILKVRKEGPGQYFKYMAASSDRTADGQPLKVPERNSTVALGQPLNLWSLCWSTLRLSFKAGIFAHHPTE